jgi:uncharacterized protein YbjQ (UPF0145 family)
MSVLLTTTNSVDGSKIKQYLGVVGSHASFDPDDSASQSQAWSTAINALRNTAEKAEADAVIGIQITTGGTGETHWTNKKGWVFVQGTSVKLEKAGFDDELPDL